MSKVVEWWNKKPKSKRETISNYIVGSICLIMAISACYLAILIEKNTQDMKNSMYECAGADVKFEYIEDIENVDNGEYFILNVNVEESGCVYLLLGSGGTRYKVEEGCGLKWKEDGTYEFWSSLSVGDKLIIKDGKYSAECIKY